MKKIESVIFEFDNYEKIEIDFIFLKKIYASGIEENIVQMDSGHFAKLRTAKMLNIIVKSCWNPKERFSNEYVRVFDKLQQDDIRLVKIKYYDETIDEFDIIGVKTSVVVESDTGDLSITARKIGA